MFNGGKIYGGGTFFTSEGSLFQVNSTGEVDFTTTVRMKKFDKKGGQVFLRKGSKFKHALPPGWKKEGREGKIDLEEERKAKKDSTYEVPFSNQGGSANFDGGSFEFDSYDQDEEADLFLSKTASLFSKNFDLKGGSVRGVGSFWGPVQVSQNAVFEPDAEEGTDVKMYGKWEMKGKYNVHVNNKESGKLPLLPFELHFFCLLLTFLSFRPW
jgi:hypothetical protein